MTFAFIILILGLIAFVWKVTDENKITTKRARHEWDYHPTPLADANQTKLLRGRSERPDDWGDDGRWV
jgi:hypothetical protein